MLCEQCWGGRYHVRQSFFICVITSVLIVPPRGCSAWWSCIPRAVLQTAHALQMEGRSAAVSLHGCWPARLLKTNKHLMKSWHKFFISYLEDHCLFELHILLCFLKCDFAFFCHRCSFFFVSNNPASFHFAIGWHAFYSCSKLKSLFRKQTISKREVNGCISVVFFQLSTDICM